MHNSQYIKISQKINIMTVYYALCIVHCALFFSCQTKHEMTESVTDIKHTPQVYADSITTIVSDSGIIRYRIIAPEWYVYEQADDQFPYSP